jgi:hypothetical protein
MERYSKQNGGIMKEVALSILLLLSTFSLAAPNPAEYSINVHVISSHWITEPSIVGALKPFKS